MDDALDPINQNIIDQGWHMAQPAFHEPGPQDNAAVEAALDEARHGVQRRLDRQALRLEQKHQDGPVAPEIVNFEQANLAAMNADQDMGPVAEEMRNNIRRDQDIIAEIYNRQRYPRRNRLPALKISPSAVRNQRYGYK